MSRQFNPNGNFADIGFSVPHAKPGVIGLISIIQHAVGATIACNHVVAMSTMGFSTGGQLFSFGYDSKGRFEAKFRSMDDNVPGFRSFKFFIFGIEFPAVIDNPALKFLQICAGGGCQCGWGIEKKDGK